MGWLHYHLGKFKACCKLYKVINWLHVEVPSHMQGGLGALAREKTQKTREKTQKNSCYRNT